MTSYLSPVSLLAQLVEHVEQAQFEQAQRLFAVISPLLGANETFLFLHRLCQGQTTLCCYDGIYYLEHSEKWRKQLEPVISGALSFWQERLPEHLKPTVLFTIKENHFASTHCLRIVNGFGVIQLNVSHVESEHLQATLVHELTHCLIATGHPFLDEGIATYAQYLSCDKNIAKRLRNNCDLPSLELLLSQGIQVDWQDLSVEVHIQNLYDFGALFFETLVEHSSIEHVVAWLDSVKPDLVQDTLVESIDRHFQLEVCDIELQLVNKRESHG